MYSFILATRNHGWYSYPTDFTIVGSQDGLTWYVVYETTGLTFSSQAESKTIVTPPNGYYKYFRFIVQRVASTVAGNASAGYPRIGEWRPSFVYSGNLDSTLIEDVKTNTAKVSADGSIDTHSDVSILTVLDQQFLKYSSFSQKWKNVSPTTTMIAEGNNLYYTDTRFDTRLALKTTSDLAEGTNLYYTEARFDTRFGEKKTTDLTEGSNLYYTEARVSANTDVNANTAYRNTGHLPLSGGTLTGDLTVSGEVNIGGAKIARGATNGLQLSEPSGNIAGPHIQAFVSSDTYPTYQLLNWVHNDIFTVYDGYFDGKWRSSSLSSNLMVNKSTTSLSFQYDSGIALGGGITWNTGFSMNTTNCLVTCYNGLDVTGNITISGTIDGVDVSALKSAVDLNTAKVSYTDADKVGLITVIQPTDLDTLRDDVKTNTSKVSASGSINTHSDVNITAPTDGNVLTYTSGEWKNIPPPAVEGYLPLEGGTLTGDLTVNGGLAIGDGALKGGMRLDGPGRSVDGPHFIAYVSNDPYPVFEILNFARNEATLAFDAYYDEGGWRSSSTASNCLFGKGITSIDMFFSHGVAKGGGLHKENLLKGFSMNTETGLVICHYGLEVKGDITVSGIVDGVDASAFKTAVDLNTEKRSYPLIDASKMDLLLVTQHVNLDAVEADTALNNNYRNIGHLPLSGGTMTGNLDMGGYNINTVGTVDGYNLDTLNTNINNKLPLTGGAINGSINIYTEGQSGSHGAVKGLYVTSDFGPYSSGAEFRHSNGTQGTGIGYAGIYACGSNGSQDLNIAPKGTTGDCYIRSSGGSSIKLGKRSHVTGEPMISLRRNGDGGEGCLGYGGNLYAWVTTDQGNRPVGGYTYLKGASGVWVDASDRRLKTDIVDLEVEDCCTKICLLKPRNYRWKRDEEKTNYMGFIADEVKQVYPDLVSNSGMTIEGDENLEGINYTGMIPVLVGAIQSMMGKINELKNRIEILESPII